MPSCKQFGREPIAADIVLWVTTKEGTVVAPTPSLEATMGVGPWELPLVSFTRKPDAIRVSKVGKPPQPEAFIRIIVEILAAALID